MTGWEMFAFDSCPGSCPAVNSSTIATSHVETPLKTGRLATSVPGCLTCMSYNSRDTKTESSGIQGSSKVLKHAYKFVILLMNPSSVQFNDKSSSGPWSIHNWLEGSTKVPPIFPVPVVPTSSCPVPTPSPPVHTSSPPVRTPEPPSPFPPSVFPQSHFDCKEVELA